jgi:tetratricopeptide (TPR) repeat protein
MSRSISSALLLATALGAVGHAAPGSPVESMIEAGSSKLEAGDADGALERFDKAARLDAKDPRPRYLSAVAWEKKGDNARAEKLFHEALTLDPKLADVRAELGALLLDEKKFDEATKELKASVAIDATQGDAWSNLGQAQLAGHHCADAAVSFGRAAAIVKDSPDPLLQQTLALRECKKPEDAVRAARQAVKLSVHDPKAQVNLALALEDLGHIDEARGALVTATQMKPDYVTGWWTLGLLELHAGKAGAAKTALERAQKLDPTPARIADVGRAWRDLGDLPKAESFFNQAIAKDAKFGPAHFYLAQVYAAEGRCADMTRELGTSGVTGERATQLRGSCKSKK